MEAKNRSRRAFVIGIVTLIIGIISFLYWSEKKQVWFCDEIYTYESANGFEEDWPANTKDEWMTGDDVIR